MICIGVSPGKGKLIKGYLKNNPKDSIIKNLQLVLNYYYLRAKKNN